MHGVWRKIWSEYVSKDDGRDMVFSKKFQNSLENLNLKIWINKVLEAQNEDLNNEYLFGN
jgi:hypothetical protein